MKKKKKRGFIDILLLLVMLIAIGVFCYAAYQLFLIFSEYKAGSDEYDILREYVQVEEKEETVDSVDEEDGLIAANEVPSCPVSVDFASLKAINEDIIGWLYVEALPNISYPMVQGEDNSFYLTHTVEKVKNSSASIFLEYRNSADFSDSNTIIYGHNMKNQSMFGLLSHLKQEDVYSKSSYIWVVTPEEEICYEIFSVRNVSELDSLYTMFVIEPEEFKTALEGYLKASQVPYDMTFDGTEKIITLSTCTSNDTVRCIVQAVRKDF